MEATPSDLQRHQELSYRDCHLNVHTTDTAKSEAVSVCPWAPRDSISASGLYH